LVQALKNHEEVLYLMKIFMVLHEVRGGHRISQLFQQQLQLREVKQYI
jgi:hypothetical protein